MFPTCPYRRNNVCPKQEEHLMGEAAWYTDFDEHFNFHWINFSTLIQYLDLPLFIQYHMWMCQMKQQCLPTKPRGWFQYVGNASFQCTKYDENRWLNTTRPSKQCEFCIYLHDKGRHQWKKTLSFGHCIALFLGPKWFPKCLNEGFRGGICIEKWS